MSGVSERRLSDVTNRQIERTQSWEVVDHDSIEGFIARMGDALHYTDTELAKLRKKAVHFFDSRCLFNMTAVCRGITQHELERECLGLLWSFVQEWKQGGPRAPEAFVPVPYRVILEQTAVCLQCGSERKRSEMISCSSCDAVFFCSSKHREASASEHLAQCDTLKAVSTGGFAGITTLMEAFSKLEEPTCSECIKAYTCVGTALLHRVFFSDMEEAQLLFWASTTLGALHLLQIPENTQMSFHQAYDQVKSSLSLSMAAVELCRSRIGQDVALQNSGGDNAMARQLAALAQFDVFSLWCVVASRLEDIEPERSVAMRVVAGAEYGLPALKTRIQLFIEKKDLAVRADLVDLRIWTLQVLQSLGVDTLQSNDMVNELEELQVTSGSPAVLVSTVTACSVRIATAALRDTGLVPGSLEFYRARDERVTFLLDSCTVEGEVSEQRISQLLHAYKELLQ